MVYSVPLHRRPFYQGLFGAVFGLANVISPLLGGAFTDSSATYGAVGLSPFLAPLMPHPKEQ